LELLLIVPFFVSLYYVLRQQIEKAFLNVYLPCTFLVPYYYHFRIPHLPVLSAGTAALMPIGFAVLFRPRIRWKFCRMDLWVTLFIISYGLSEVLREYSPKDGMILWLTEFLEMFLGYVVGRQIIEPNLRLETVKRIVFLFVLQTPLALFEYRFGQNLWLNFGRNLFGLYDVGWFVQLRGGTARIATCFGHAILAGIMFLIAFALNYYLIQIYKRDKTRLGPRMALLQKFRVPFFLLPVFTYMTGSRMPMACIVLCFLLLQIPRFKSIRTGAITILLIVGIGAGAVYAAFEKYTSVSEDQVTDEAQSSAIYRRQLVEEYAPVLEGGGWLGWGALSHPIMPGLGSIDNNYMLIQLSQGKLGKYTFYLIALESVFGLAMCAVRFRTRESLFLVFSLTGALIGTFVALTTVYLGEQLPQVLFLLLGWAQSLQDTSVFSGASAANALPEPKFRFKRVIA
jgi:hypothetical protein